jgi:hypothetical protein
MPHMNAPTGTGGNPLQDGLAAVKEFGRWLVSDLKRAKCTNEELTAIVLGALSTTITFIRWNRREVLRANPTARALAKQAWDFENALLGSVVDALPQPPKRGRKEDSDAQDKFIQIVKLRKQSKNWDEIAVALAPEFGHASAGAYKKHYKRFLPKYLKWYKDRFMPEMAEEEFLEFAMPQTKRPAGRPKSGHKSRQ